MQRLFSIVMFYCVCATPQINLYFTDSMISESNGNLNGLQHSCLRITEIELKTPQSRPITSFCMGESSTQFTIKTDNLLSNYTFAELKEQNITSEQLYYWSAPIDIIERYQFYLNQLSITNSHFLGKEIFYNCTLPWFGPLCQYQFDYHHPNHTSLEHIIRDFYDNNPYKPNNLTCYEHLSCQHTTYLGCLDWTEICDGHVHCLNEAIDEKLCWQLEINECKENEYRCPDGQCIPMLFDANGFIDVHCLDALRYEEKSIRNMHFCSSHQPTIECEERRCTDPLFMTSCVQPRVAFLIKLLFSIKDNSTTDDCWSAMKCLIRIPDFNCENICQNDQCLKIIEQICPNIIYIPSIPILYGTVYHTYINNPSTYFINAGGSFTHMCSNRSLDDYSPNDFTISLNNVTCYVYVALITSVIPGYPQTTALYDYIDIGILEYNPFKNLTYKMCNRSNTYRCQNSSKCISIHRLADRIRDCPKFDDEEQNIPENVLLTEYFCRNRFKCPISNTCVPLSIIKVDKCGCGTRYENKCELDYVRQVEEKKSIIFKKICDTKIDLDSINIDGQNKTDETECDQWPCNNAYTRCDGRWHCPKGDDEVGCDVLFSRNCSSKEHVCVSVYTKQIMCLPLEKVNDGNIDCVGALDEPKLCTEREFSTRGKSFYCETGRLEVCISPMFICNTVKNCINEHDEIFCEKKDIAPLGLLQRPSGGSTSKHSNMIQVIHNNLEINQFLFEREFVLNNIHDFESYPVDQTNNLTLFSPEIIQIPRYTQISHCHRGLDLRVWLDRRNNLSTSTCLCPPSYYGSQCQYQNQRISLTLRIRGTLDTWQTAFVIVVMLIGDDNNNQRIIQSYEQMTYLSMRDCNNKFEFYLLYGTQPKNPTYHYTIHIDIYEKSSLNYRGSFILPIQFSFLPVHRLSFLIDIPRIYIEVKYCSNFYCKHGKCIQYMNNFDVSFCQCIPGWAGRHCTIPYSIQCSLDSLSIGINAHNQSICICPLHRFGPRCLLFNTICQNKVNSTCQNGGQCIPPDDFLMSTQKPSCLCPRGFRGNQCEIAENEIILSFEKDIRIPQSIFVHFIEIYQENKPRCTTTFKTILIQQDSIILYWSQPYHLIFIELTRQNYYLISINKTYTRSIKFYKKISSFDHCPHINKISNKQFSALHLLQRIKSYHKLCQTNQTRLKCFHDELQLCLCYIHTNNQYLVNCFQFNHSMKFDCSGQNHCENNGQCFQDTLDCSRRIICLCPRCFYGSRCQFSTNGFGLSLDDILSYHISPQLSFRYQSSIVQISIVLMSIFVLVGLIDGIIGIITFWTKAVCTVGCGIYLLGSSVTTLLVIFVLSLKLSILILTQTLIIKNWLFLSIQCYSIEILLRICFYMNQWLYACVAIERTITTIKGSRFQRKKSKQMAKKIILILLILIIVTNIHDPMYRRLIFEKQDDDDKRIWCIVTYSSQLQTYNYIINILHFIGPFLCNLISSIIIITNNSRRKFRIQHQQTFKKLLQKQISHHKRLVIGPFVLVILAIPRLIISFITKCMSSTNESWLFLTAYFISFIPTIVTSLLFIIPSKFYKNEFHTKINRYRTKIQRRLKLNS
ncbi:hypothetical protein I4U23_017251 [Adineta vaga]|nr:hypothetical protein I4U23_017251 [Adineta vaga]